EFPFGRSGHDDVIVVAPVDLERASAWHGDGYRAAGAAGSCGRNSRGTGRRAAGRRQAGASLPGAQIQRVTRSDLSDRDVGSLGEDWMVFEQRPETIELVGPDVAVYPEDGVRVAHAGDRGRMQHRRVDRA